MATEEKRKRREEKRADRQTDRQTDRVETRKDGYLPSIIHVEQTHDARKRTDKTMIVKVLPNIVT